MSERPAVLRALTAPVTASDVRLFFRTWLTGLLAFLLLG